MITILTIVSILLVVPISLIASWQLAPQLGETRSYRIIDFVIVSWILMIVVGRAAGLIFFSSQLTDLSWHLLPVVETSTGIQWFNSWPWIIFKINDGRFLFIDLVSPIIFAELILSLLNRVDSFGKKSFIYKQYATLTFAASLLPFVIAMYFNRHLLPFFQPGGWLLATICLVLVSAVRLIVPNKVMIRVLLIILNIIPIVYLNLTATEYSFNTQGLTIALSMVIALEVILTLLQLTGGGASNTATESNVNPVGRRGDPRAMERYKKLEQQQFYEIDN